MGEEPSDAKPEDPPPPSLSPAPSAPPMPDLHRSPETPGPQPTADSPVKTDPAVEEDEEDDDSVEPELNHRLLAAVIDMLVAAGVGFAAGWVLPDWEILSRLPWLMAAAYLVARDSIGFLGGQSVGKRAMKLKVETQEGNPLVSDWTTALIRNGVLLIPFFALVEAIVLMSREEKPERGLRLGDEWAKTRVRKAEGELEVED